ncbi:hypothetical protein JVU11DRAFT_10298 [Chiua virens]|nr:hypothetical protein JVU11DRAFT_10298 [Chiua virens]
MGQDYSRGLTSHFASPLQLLHRRSVRANGRSDALVSPDESTVADDARCPLITHIRVTYTSTKLKRVPVEFYITVKSANGTHHTSNKSAVAGRDVVEWDDEILLPPEHSSKISFAVFVSFELESTLGCGEAVREIDVTVGELLGRSSDSEFIKIYDQDDGNVEIKIRGSSGCVAVSDPSASEATSRIKESTDMSRHALARCRKLLEYSGVLARAALVVVSGLIDHERAISMLEVLVRDISDDHHYKPLWLTTLASLLWERYERLGDVVDLDRCISLEEHALRLTPDDHPDRLEDLGELEISLSRRYKHFGDTMDLEKLISLQEERLRLAPDGHPDRPSMLDSLAQSLSSRYKCVRDIVDLEKSISLEEDALRLTPDDDPDKHSMLANLALSLKRRYERFRNIVDLEKSLSLGEEALRLMSDEHPHRPSTLTNLALSFLDRYERCGDIVDLEKSISFEENALRLMPDDHPDKPSMLANLALPFQCRYKRSGDIADLAKSVSLKEDALQLMPDDHPDKPSMLDSLATTLSSRYKCFGDIADLEKAMSLDQDALRLTPDDHPGKRSILANLALSSRHRYERSRNIVDLERSLSLGGDALRLMSDEHPHRPSTLSNLAVSLLSRYERIGDIMDLERSISLKEDALRLTPDHDPDKPSRLSSLASSLQCRYGRFGKIVDLEKSVSLMEDALQLTPDDHPEKRPILGNLALSLFHRHDRTGDRMDLEKSISLQQDALQLTPNDHPDKPTSLANLVVSFKRRYERFGDIADLERSLSLGEDALGLISDEHPHKPSTLNNIAVSFSDRYERFGDVVDLEKSIFLRKDALRLTPDGHPDKPLWLVSLAQSLSHRYKRFEDIVDLENSLSLGKDALQLTPDDHPGKSTMLNNLSVLLESRYQRFRNVVDLQKSITLREDALRLTPDDHPDKPSLLTNLAQSLMSRCKCSGDILDLEKSISLSEDALRLTSDDHPNKPLRLANLARSLLSRYQYSLDVADLEKSIDADTLRLPPDDHPHKLEFLNVRVQSLLQKFQHFADASTSDVHQAISLSSRATHSYTGKPSVRFESSQVWIRGLRLLQKGTQSLFDAYTISVYLLPQLAWIGSSFQDRYHKLLEAGGVVSDAAAVALSLRRPELAIEWLDQGRSIVWSQVSQLRTPVDDLRSAHPALAAKFEHVSHELEHAGVRHEEEIHGLTTSESSYMTGLLKPQARQYHRLSFRRDDLLAEIRALPGFERFLLPKKIDQLSSLVHLGHVVFLNACKPERRCDALVITATSNKVLHVPLSLSSYTEIVTMRRQLSGLLRYHGRVIARNKIDDEDRVGGAARPARLHPNEIFITILSKLWNTVISPILDVLGLSTPPAELPRIFWCPTGPFTLLPIHAAGLYDATNPGPKLSNSVISSYIPTMSTLQDPPQQDLQTSSSTIRMLAVPQPNTDGDLPLNGVKVEMGFMRELTSSSPFMNFQEADGTVEDVLAKMKVSDWVHFCCHGTQDHTNPLDSGLLLADRTRLKLSDVVQLARPRGGLAFLSACQTAMGDEKLSDEAIHLAAGMLLAGYSGVIATMWSIMDRDAPMVTKDVYTSLFGEGRVPDSRRAAEALHHAIDKLRNSGAPFLSWVPFVHYGS